jgi:hypothetical protein
LIPFEENANQAALIINNVQNIQKGSRLVFIEQCTITLHKKALCSNTEPTIQNKHSLIMGTEITSAMENAVMVPETVEQPSFYPNASLLKVTPEEQKLLEEPIDPLQVEIRPDGLIYLPQAFVRMKLNKTFGIGQWALVKKDVKVDSVANKCYYDGILLIRGCYVSEAVGEAEYHVSNKMQSWASVSESAKSDCIVRCCKDLGVASELWQPQFSKEWVKQYAIKVFVEVERNGVKKKEVRWRKTTDDPFWNECGQLQNQQQSKTETRPTDSPDDILKKECLSLINKATELSDLKTIKGMYKELINKDNSVYKAIAAKGKELTPASPAQK